MKEIQELTKEELRSEIVWTKKVIMRYRKEIANSDIEFDAFNEIRSWKDSAKPYIKEIEKRGVTKVDRQRVNSFYDEYWKADKLIEKKLGIGQAAI